MSFDFGSYEHYGLALVALFGTFLAVAFLLWLCQKSPYAETIKTFRGVSPPFVGVIGVLFALNLAFLANDTWNAHDRARDAVFQEAGSLRNILALTDHLPAAIKSPIGEAVRQYARTTVEAEWPLLGLRQSSPEAAAQLDRLLELLSSQEVASATNAEVHALLLQQTIQVRSTRDTRIALSQTHVNPLKWLGMAFLGFLTMVLIAMIHVDQARAEFVAIMLFAAASAPTAAIVLIQGNPFQQPTSVAAAPIASLLR